MATKKKASPAKGKKVSPAKKKTKAPVKKQAPKAKKPLAKTKKSTAKAKKAAPAKKPIKKAAPPKKKVIIKKKVQAKASKKVAPAKKSLQTKAKAPVKIKAPVKVSKPAKAQPAKVKSASPADSKQQKILKTAPLPKKAEAKPAAKAVVPAPKVEKPKAPERDPIEDDPLLAAARRRDAGALERKPSRRSIRNIVLPRPPIFPRKFDEPLPPFPKVTGEKKQFKMEFEVRSSPRMLYNYLSTASGLAAWFANDVNVRDGIFTFFWNGSTARAKSIFSRDCHAICFQWLDETDHSYFLFEIVQDDITGDVALVITDFANPSEMDQNRMLWNSQIHALMQVIGS